MIENPSAFPCSRCGEASSHKQGHQWLCPKHYRFGQMRSTAKRRGLVVPEHAELEALVPDKMACPECSAQMNWLAKCGQSTVASLQHYRDGTLALVCRSCNTRHAFAPGDSFRDAPKDHKHCPQCQTFKPFTDFSADRGRSGSIKLKSWCRACSHAAHTNWRIRNREHYNAKQREGRARRGSAD